MKISCTEVINSLGPMVQSHQGNLEITFTNVRSLERAGTDSLIFVKATNYFQAALSSIAPVILLPSNMAQSEELKSLDLKNRCILFSDTPELTLAHLLKKYFARDPLKIPREKNISSRAIIDPSAQIAKTACIDAGAVIGAHVVIGECAWVGSSAVVEERCHIGDHSRVHPLVYLGSHTHIGKHCEIHSQASLGDCAWGFGDITKTSVQKNKEKFLPENFNGKVVLEDHVEIGANCLINRSDEGETRIGAWTKFDNFCLIAHNVKLGRGCLLTGGVKIAAHATLGDFCVLGGNAMIAEGVKVSNMVHIGGISYVQEDIKTPGAYGGHPLQPLKDYLRTTASLSHLPQIRKDVSELNKKIAELNAKK